MTMPENEEWLFIGFIAIFVFVIGIALYSETSKRNRERVGDEITIIEKKVDGEARLIVYKSKTEDRGFCSVYGDSNGWGIFSTLKVGGKYKVSIRRSDESSKFILKILKVISEPLVEVEKVDPYKALTNMREGIE